MSSGRSGETSPADRPPGAEPPCSGGAPAALALALGYLAGGALSFGVRFLGLFPTLESPMARLTMVLVGMGMLGASVHGSWAWSRRATPTGGGGGGAGRLRAGWACLAAILGGGITGVVLYLAVKAAIAAALVGDVTPDIRYSVALLIAFAGGLLHLRLRRGLGRVLPGVGDS